MSDDGLLQYEIAGTVISLKEEEAALVIYADKESLGKEICFAYDGGSGRIKQRVHFVQRNIDGKLMCVTIIPRIECSTDRVDVTNQSHTTFQVGDSNIVTVYKGNIAEAYAVRGTLLFGQFIPFIEGEGVLVVYASAKRVGENFPLEYHTQQGTLVTETSRFVYKGADTVAVFPRIDCGTENNVAVFVSGYSTSFAGSGYMTIVRKGAVNIAYTEDFHAPK